MPDTARPFSVVRRKATSTPASANPTIRALEDSVAELENGCGGIATSPGMGAVSTVYLALLEAGAHMVSTASVYGPSRGLMEKHFSRFGVQSTYVDTRDLAQVRAGAAA